jgi:hypothetical protein
MFGGAVDCHRGIRVRCCRMHRSEACRFRPVLGAIALVSAALSACSANRPTMRLNHAEITGVRIALPPSINVLMTVYVDVHNSNSYDIAVRAVRGQVLLANRYPLPVDFRPGGDGVWLAAGSTTSVAVPLTIPAQIGLALVQQSFSSPTIPYQFVGRADVTATRTLQIEKDDYSVNESGFMSRQQLEVSLRAGF